MAESIGIGGRGDFYEEVGVLSDVVQNHMLELLALVAMEPPASFAADDIRDEKVKLLRAVRPPDAVRDAVRGQYAGYRNEPHVPPDSQTATFAALRLGIDNWRWQGVPFYLRAGKRLATQVTEIVIQFHAAPAGLFCDTEACRILTPNVLTLRIQPNERIDLSFMVKPPGMALTVQPETLDFNYHCRYGAGFDAYERLLLNVLQGDQTLFVRRDAVEAQWRIIEPVLEAWKAQAPQACPCYEPGSWGPAGAEELMLRDGRAWKNE